MRQKQLLALLANNARTGSIKAEGNTIYLYDTIVATDEEALWFGGVSPTAFIKALESIRGPVTLRVNSPGGDVFGARAMVQAMRDHVGEITVHVDGLAASAASLIVAAGARAIMAEGAFLMIHRSWSFVAGNTEDLLQMAALLEKVDGTLADTYAARGQGDASHYLALMAAETWFTPAEALAEGLIDEVVTPEARQTAPAAKWDLSAFAHAPKGAEPAEPAPVATPSDSADPVDPVDDRSRRLRLHQARLAAMPL